MSFKLLEKNVINSSTLNILLLGKDQDIKGEKRQIFYPASLSKRKRRRNSVLEE